MKTAGQNSYIAGTLKQGALIVLIAAVLSLAVNHFRQGGVPLIGDWSPKAGSSALKTAGEPIISIDEARALFLTNGAVFIDARPEEVYRAGHIKGALNLPPDSLDKSLPAAIAKIPRDSLIVTYCDGENCSLSENAALQLAAKGYSNVQVLLNGWTVWQKAGLPTGKTP